jgi:hypothetical protein
MIDVNGNIRKYRLTVSCRNAMGETNGVGQQPKNYPFPRKRGEKYPSFSVPK